MEGAIYIGKLSYMISGNKQYNNIRKINKADIKQLIICLEVCAGSALYLLVPVIRNELGSSCCIALRNKGNSSSGTIC